MASSSWYIVWPLVPLMTQRKRSLTKKKKLLFTGKFMAVNLFISYSILLSFMVCAISVLLILLIVYTFEIFGLDHYK